MSLHVVPLELAEANALVSQLHRHHQPSQGHRFSLGVMDDQGVLHGAAIVGRPVARLSGSPRDVLEVVRLVTDGYPNACSMLYAAAARAGRAMGYRRIQTYILGSETGTSLKAAGWMGEGSTGGGQWKHTDGRPRRTDQPTEFKGRWAKPLAARPGPERRTGPSWARLRSDFVRGDGMTALNYRRGSPHYCLTCGATGAPTWQDKAAYAGVLATLKETTP